MEGSVVPWMNRGCMPERRITNRREDQSAVGPISLVVLFAPSLGGSSPYPSITITAPHLILPPVQERHPSRHVAGHAQPHGLSDLG